MRSTQYSYEESEALYFANIANLVNLVKCLTFPEVMALLANNNLPELASYAYRQVHALLYPSALNMPHSRSVLINAREIYHALICRMQQPFLFRMFARAHTMLMRYIPLPMNSSTAEEKEHEALIGVAHAYQIPVNDKGICYGIHVHSFFAIMLGELSQLDARIKRNLKPDPAKVRKLGDYLKNLITYTDLSAEEQEDVTFFQNIDVCQSWHNYSGLTTNAGGMQRHFEECINLLGPESLPKLVRMGLLTGVYDRCSLARLLDQMEATIFSDEKMGPIAIRISNQYHIITVTYDLAAKTWRLINASSSAAIDSRFIADNIIRTFRYMTTGYIVLNFDVIATHQALRYTVPAMQQLSDWHNRYIQQHAVLLQQVKDAEENTALRLAMAMGDMQTVSFLLTLGMDWNLEKNTYLHPIFIAIRDNLHFVIDALIQSDVDVNLQTPDYSLTPLVYAVLKSNLIITDKLLALDNIEIGKVCQSSVSAFVSLGVKCDIPYALLYKFVAQRVFGGSLKYTARDILELIDNNEMQKIFDDEITLDSKTRCSK